MRFQLISFIALVAFVSVVNCGCDRSSEEIQSDDGELTQFFKNLGCDIKKGADKVSESAKPYIDDIKKGAEKVSESAKPYIDDLGNRAKKLGGTVADRFNDLKEKISGSSDDATAIPAETRSADEASLSSESSLDHSSSTPLSSSILPDIEDRFILDVDQPKCGDKQKNDGRGHCRNTG